MFVFTFTDLNFRAIYLLSLYFFPNRLLKL